MRHLKDICPPCPIAAVDFWHDVLTNYSMESFSQYVENSCSALSNIAQDLDALSENYGIGKMVSGGGVSIVGGAIALGGLVLAPFTGGVSTVATFGGLTGILGGVGSIGANIGKSYSENIKQKEAKAKTERAIELSSLLLKLINEYMLALKRSGEYINDVNSQSDEMLLNKIRNSRAYRYYTEARMALDQTITVKDLNAEINVSSFKELRQVAKATGISGSRLLVMAGYRTAGRYSATIYIPGFKWWTISLVQAGARTTRYLSLAGGAFGVAFGVYDCIEGIKDIKIKSEAAKSFRELADNLKAQKEEILEAYNTLIFDD